VTQFIEASRYKQAGHEFDFFFNFSLTQFFLPHDGSEIDSVSNRNEYQEYFMEVKVAGA
jgi:hypothetical protein